MAHLNRKLLNPCPLQKRRGVLKAMAVILWSVSAYATDLFEDLQKDLSPFVRGYLQKEQTSIEVWYMEEKKPNSQIFTYQQLLTFLQSKKVFSVAIARVTCSEGVMTYESD